MGDDQNTDIDDDDWYYNRDSGKYYIALSAVTCVYVLLII